MIELAGAPILEHHLRWLREQGVERAILLTGYLHQVVSSYFAEPRVEGLRVECVVEERPLGRGGAFRRGFEEAQINDHVVVATNGDVLTDQALAPMADAHTRAGAAATILLTQMVSPYGIVDVGDDGLVRAFEEKPKLPHWINGGVYLLDASVFAEFPEEGDHETASFPRLAAEGRLAAFRSEAPWHSVDSQKDLREAEEYLVARQR